jgi:hypothetical protein
MMGAGNIRLVYVYWHDLPGAPFRALVYMALRTRDNEPEPQFWAGREELAFALGRIVPPVTDNESRRVRRAAFQAVKDATGVLLRRGAIATAERAGPGRNAVYALRLTPERGRPSLPHMGEGIPTPVGEENPTEWGREILTTGEEKPTPEEKKDKSGLKVGVETEGDHHGAGVAHTRANHNDDHHSYGETPVLIAENERDALHCGDPQKRHAAATAILARREDLGAPFIDQAQTEMPGADRSAIVVRAAQIFAKGLQQ